MIVDQALKEATAELAASAGIWGEPRMQRLRTRGHNRLFRVEVGNATLVLKRYFPGIGARRDRLRSEFTFSRFAWSLGVRAIPEPVAADYTRCSALFRFVEGRAMTDADLTPANLAAAIAFVEHINRDRKSLSAQALPVAFGGLSSVAEHIDGLSARLLALRERADAIDVDSSMREMMDERLRPAWTRIARQLGACPRPGPDERCISPSNFGFHNAMVLDSGELIFHDFEYAGWDDPARLVAELFAQSQFPVPYELFDTFAAGICEVLGLPDGFIERTARLVPLYRVYACCALLDEILPAGGRDAARNRRGHSKDGRWALVQQAIADLGVASI